MATEDDDLIGTRAAADLLRIDRSTITRWIQAGKLTPALKLGGRTGAMLFKRAEVEALAKEAA